MGATGSFKECFVGIDLGSTTTKAVFLDGQGRVLGRGITNSRSNYEVACQVAKEEAEIDARFGLLKDAVRAIPGIGALSEELMAWLSAKFALAAHLKQLAALRVECFAVLEESSRTGDEKAAYRGVLKEVLTRLDRSAEGLFLPGGRAQSDFFRDIATSHFLREAEGVLKERGSQGVKVTFDRTVGIFDKAILRTENQSFARFFVDYMKFAAHEVAKLPKFKSYEAGILKAADDTVATEFRIGNTVGTGYGRLTLPFPKESIRSEILCHGLGAHHMFPGTRTVLDIGGQDTKAIQVDEKGIVTSFQMNDRCAAGCGRYLGYIADEMNMGVHELGPLAAKSDRPARINSTCTVFAGAELRERLALGERREDILAGLHRAIILRAMSLLARSGGIKSQFTFTGGVARNEAAVGALKRLVAENYGEMPMNISAESIYTGALGASLFALRDAVRA